MTNESRYHLSRRPHKRKARSAPRKTAQPGNTIPATTRLNLNTLERSLSKLINRSYSVEIGKANIALRGK